MSKNDMEFPDYITFGRTFERYRWYKPLLVIISGIVLYFVFQIILGIIFNVIYGENILTTIMNGGYETLNTYDASVYYSYLSVAVFIPSLYLASRIVRDRPFSSYSSSRGGWNWKLYFKCLAIPIIIYVIYYAISLIINPESGASSEVSLVTVIIATILIPVQCIAEEYVFRGVLMQTIGSWFKIPILAIIIQAIIFAIGHTYDIKGVIAVFISGIVLALLTWKSNGLEAGSAIHSINNLMAF
ncbi:CPBP family intramembrane glutamic endopeptidase, partial [Methanobrevibacter sp.]|uniref:CPBP family intramembrane glutamic endopeptidase n=1 Tax=Methanobrevibacter sp. TaxID=66852 RepID=UPI0026DFE161